MSADVSEPASVLWYFAYGSNMHPAIFLERRGMRPRAARAARVDDHRLCFNLPIGPGERGVANLEPEAGARTCGVLYLLTAEECDRLDRTEGVHVGAYRRVAVDIMVDGGERVAAFTYRSWRTRAGRKPSPRYMRLLIEGATHHDLPSEYVRWLATIELARDERQGAEGPAR